uniref:Uncharacterized protein n=1 Tax=Lepeophtheirus salmonis TaxID=72036 RepID=A0A0K2T4Q1_LEPSM
MSISRTSGHHLVARTLTCLTKIFGGKWSTKLSNIVNLKYFLIIVYLFKNNLFSTVYNI